MSIPPQLIRVKRKRDDEAPVTFLQFDQGAKRSRTSNNWVYQRRLAVPQSQTAAARARDAQPVIHISTPDDDSVKRNKHHVGHAAQPGGAGVPLQATKPTDASRLAAPRRFHISKKMMMASGNMSPGSVLSKKPRYGPAVFVERSNARAVRRAVHAPPTEPAPKVVPVPDVAIEAPIKERRLKRPTAKSRSRSPQDPSLRSPLPASAMNPHTQDMSKVAADMNNWVMSEIGATLHEMELEKQKAEATKFRPKAPAKRYQERHPELVRKGPEATDMEIDTPMSDVSDIEDEDDWVIEEYVRIPAHAMYVNVEPTDVGVLVLDGEEDSNLFFGPDRDEDEDLDEDDEDENAENYYTADYPEDEVESDDEYNRFAYEYRNGNASDNEEYDNRDYEEVDDDQMVIEGAGDDVAMARIKAYMKRSQAFQ
ncbi:hypothetical protein B0T10DRAFT_172552 [Thelonectria olida]|uniref:Transcription factor Iwr1 domain-containing protein n=1 Tax=Thelonectria olida TaxID=1576542 RepID=A0A9P8WEK5_9HYPO|nr:hypothetical protein B0T10DRAFT_172552 [Thelonectria olida]